MIYQRNIGGEFLRKIVAQYVLRHLLLWRKTVILLCFWLLCLALMIHYQVDHWQTSYVEEEGKGSLDCDFPTNRMGSFAYRGLDAENDYRPLHLIRFNELSTESGQLGLFRTGAYRTVCITGLHLKLYSYVADGDIQSRDNSYLDTQNASQKDILAVIQALTRKNTVSLQDDRTEHSISTNAIIGMGDIDLNNIGKIMIREFDYELFADGNKVVSIKSALANLSYAMEDIVLRGHVRISSGEGDILESNHVCWNSQTERFMVKGNYVLTRGEEKFFGEDILVDMTLNEIYGEQANLDNQEGDKCSRI